MASAKCSQCGKTTSWKATRGARLSDHRSACCNAPLQGVNAGGRGYNAGKRFGWCYACKGRRLRSGLVRLPGDWWKWPTGPDDNGELPRDPTLCRYHVVWPSPHIENDPCPAGRIPSAVDLEPLHAPRAAES